MYSNNRESDGGCYGQNASHIIKATNDLTPTMELVKLLDIIRQKSDVQYTGHVTLSVTN